MTRTFVAMVVLTVDVTPELDGKPVASDVRMELIRIIDQGQEATRTVDGRPFAGADVLSLEELP